MVSLKSYYENVHVELDGTTLSRRIKEQLDKVIGRLPDEEQFKIMGEFYIGQRDWIQNFLVEQSMILHTGDPRTVLTLDGNFIFDIHEVLEDSEYIITLVTNGLDEKSDDYVIGLIAYKISEWSRLWRKIKDTHNWEDLNNEERIQIIHGTPQSRLCVGTQEREEYERSVDEEARHLGFSSELNAYDIQL